MDVSFLADCFKPYGSHPLNAIVKRISPLTHSSALLMGNMANFFLDSTIHSEKGKLDYLETMKRFFLTAPLEFAMTNDLDDPTKRKEFIEESRRQFDHIQHSVYTSFEQLNYPLPQEELLIEPSFISHRLGLQGRLDAIRSNYLSFVELKSSKMSGWGDQLSAVESHNIQLQLYATLIREIEQIESRGYLFYSKYPRLIYEPIVQETVEKALNLRNKIVENDLSIAQSSDLISIKQLFGSITPTRLNQRGLSDRFWEQYLSKPIKEFEYYYEELTDTEKDYLAESYRFIVTEWYKGKVGCTEEEYLNGGRNLGKGGSLKYKIEAGEAIDNLKISGCLDENREVASEEFSILQLETAFDDSISESNFRIGDLVWVYIRPNEIDSSLNRRVIKGTILEMINNRILVQLLYNQRNNDCIDLSQYYVLEQGESEVNNNAFFHGLYYYMTANRDRRTLLLGSKLPHSRTNRIENRSTQSDLERILDKVDRCNDYFLLVGPPGSGKTSIALRAIVEQECSKIGTHVLVLAYTNRAVDEICGSLGSLHVKYPILRMGSLTACDQVYQSLHYSQQLSHLSDRKEVIEQLKCYRIVVSTIATFISKLHLFRFCRYDLAILDEASQVLEPQLLSVICSKDKKGDNMIEKWVMIGDQKQLPAVVIQSDNESTIGSEYLRALGIVNFKESLFERLLKKVSQKGLSDCFDQISIQGRMHPDVADYSNRYYYNLTLSPVPLFHQLEDKLYLNYSSNGLEYLLATRRTLFLEVVHKEKNALCKQNISEVDAVERVIQQIFDLYSLNGLVFDPLTTIGVIAPFRSQIALIKQKLNRSTNPLFQSITIDTVERFQGSQREIIIYSFCVSNVEQLNWISSPRYIDDLWIDRKLNVVLTRAKRQFVLIGNREIIECNPLFSHFIEYIQIKDCIFELPNETTNKTMI